MWVRRIITAAGVVLIADVTFVLVNKIRERFNDSFEVLSFGEKFTCSDKRCKDPGCSYHNVITMCKTLQSAQHSLDVCMYLLTNKRLCARLLDAHLRGVDVRIIVDVNSGLNLTLQALRKAGVKIGWDHPASGTLMHHKFCVIDGRLAPEPSVFDRFLDTFLPPIKRAIVITGSLNWTDKSVLGNYENVNITNDPIIVSQYQTLFNDIAPDFFQ